MENKKILLLGLPSTGKSTYLAALWYFIINNNGEGLSINSLADGEHEYLNQLSRDWAMCNPVQRTLVGKHEKFVVNVKNNETGNVMTLDIPDMSGEFFKTLFDSREWPIDFDILIKEMGGLVLFIDPTDKANKPAFVWDSNELVKMFGETPVGNKGIVEWSSDLAPNQVKIVDFLQLMSFYRTSRERIKVSVVISCWDLVKNAYKDDITPIKWCQKELPLLVQFLEANDFQFTTLYFGVSAQGGDYSRDKEKLLTVDPLERIIVEDGGQPSKNIAKTISWIADEN